jgi:argininosuccinate lyase
MTTGSSIMPQKRNPDVLELIRGATATLQASLIEVLSLTAKLSSGYQRDLQRIKAPLFRAIDLSAESGEIMGYLIDNVRFIPENIAIDQSAYAAGHANRLVLEEGISFREAYRRVAQELFGED